MEKLKDISDIFIRPIIEMLYVSYIQYVYVWKLVIGILPHEEGQASGRVIELHEH